MFEILDTTFATNILRSLLVATAAVGVFFFMSAFLPESWNTYKTKNTVGMNKNMFLLHGGAGLFFLLGALCLIVQVLTGEGIKKLPDLFITGLLFSINTGCSFIGCIYTYRLKIRNSRKAAEQGISEKEYHEKRYGYLSTKNEEWE